VKQTQRFALLVGFLLVALITGGSHIAWAGPSPAAPVNVTEGVALKGYDPVAYFTVGKPTLGMAQFSHRWQGATYQFASSEHLERFKAEPEKYLPQYGGYCAYALSINRIADIDPDRWAVVEGKLYLNNNFFVHKLWSVSKSSNIEAANKNWAVWPKVTASE
jgi:YHS domain-containing protein